MKRIVSLLHMNTLGRGSKNIRQFRHFLGLQFLFLLIAGAGQAIDITSLEDLEKIGEDAGYPLDGDYVVTQDIDASGSYESNGGLGFDPIGDSDTPFTGTFDGQGHVIQYLHINRNGFDHTGLFAEVEDPGMVMNLGLVGVEIWGNNYTGGLVGHNLGVITACYTSIIVWGNGNYTGGLTGFNEGAITQCYAMGAVRVLTDSDYVAGLVGFNVGTVSQCYSAGIVTGSAAAYGLIGYNGGTVTACYWDTDTSGQIDDYYGGTGKTTEEMMAQSTFIGWDFGGVWNIFEGFSYPFLSWQQGIPGIIKISTLQELQRIGNHPSYPLNGHYELTMDLDAGETSGWFDGSGFQPVGDEEHPFFGVFDGKDHVISNLVINRSSESFVALFGAVDTVGTVKAVGLADCSISGLHYTGGVAGRNAGTLESCFSAGMIAGGNDVGALAGANTGTIKTCHASGAVAGSSYVGGVTGFNSGAIIDAYARTDVSGTDTLGGVTGYNGNSVTHAYATGTITGGTDTGGLIGFNDGTVTGSFWDKETSGTDTSSGGSGLSTASMMSEATFANAGWDMTTVWGILDGGSYPFLQAHFTTQMMNVVGGPLGDAANMISNLGLRLCALQEANSDEVPAGHIISQSPPAGAYVNIGTPVCLVVSLGSGNEEGEEEGEGQGPDNDLCSEAIPLTTGQAFLGSTVGATGEDRSTCATNDFLDVWFSFVPPQTGEYTVSLCGSSFDTTLAIFSGNCDNLVEVGCNDDWCGTSSQLCLMLNGAETVWVRVSGYNGEYGDYVLNVSTSCGNDEGEAVEGEAVEGEAVEGEVVEGEAVEGEAVEGEAGILHPADTNANWRMTLGEAIPYLSGWQRGSNPMAYAIRAAYLWQNGEFYVYRSDRTPPLCWVLTN